MLILPPVAPFGLGAEALGAADALGELARLLAPEETLGAPPPTFEIPPMFRSLKKYADSVLFLPSGKLISNMNF